MGHKKLCLNWKDQPSNQVPLRSLSIHIQVVGFLTSTTLLMEFENEENRELEGELLIPLDDGEKMSGYAVDIKGAMVDAVAVEKEKAR